jgi:hypothetical protein
MCASSVEYGEVKSVALDIPPITLMVVAASLAWAKVSSQDIVTARLKGRPDCAGRFTTDQHS